MKNQLVLTALLSALLVPTLFGGEGVVFSPFSGASTFWGVAGMLPEGSINCIGGTQTGSWPVCTPESIRSIIRGLLLLHYQTSDDTPFSGLRTTVLNANLDRYGEGPMWGTWQLEIDSEDWGCPPAELCRTEGTYTGSMGPGFTEWKVVGVGTSGLVEGVKVHLVGAADASLNEVFSGYYFFPPRKGHHKD